MPTSPISISPTDTEQLREMAQQAGDALRAGKLVIFPTETVYGVAASAASEEGLERLRRFKARPDAQPFTIHLPDAHSAGRYMDVSQPRIQRLLRKSLPGPITLVVDVDEAVIERKLKDLGLKPEHRQRIYHGATVGLRCPDHPLAQTILGSVDGPVVASSANGRGEDPPQEVEAAARSANEDVALIIDGGRCQYAKPSTILRVTGEGIHQSISLQREGVYDERFIRKLLRWTALFVCSGNTCRSPMAEAIAKSMLAEERGITIDELESAGISVISAGAHTQAGMPANPESLDAMARQGLDLANHRSQPLTRQLIDQADVIYCMTSGHVQAVLELAPEAADKTTLLDPNRDIDDPIGAGPTAYQRSAEIIRRRLAQRLKEQQP